MEEAVCHRTESVLEQDNKTVWEALFKAVVEWMLRPPLPIIKLRKTGGFASGPLYFERIRK
ncbi:hypothetical protein GCM10008933_41070 [Paenibacillus motobuensis]|uniref:Uncharacterized protein n=1 Tax=Paenibacillus motobuensis TaxID=295324 RepID=A0ABN0YR61_9BACL